MSNATCLLFRTYLLRVNRKSALNFCKPSQRYLPSVWKVTRLKIYITKSPLKLPINNKILN